MVLALRALPPARRRALARRVSRARAPADRTGPGARHLHRGRRAHASPGVLRRDAAAPRAARLPSTLLYLARGAAAVVAAARRRPGAARTGWAASAGSCYLIVAMLPMALRRRLPEPARRRSSTRPTARRRARSASRRSTTRRRPGRSCGWSATRSWSRSGCGRRSRRWSPRSAGRWRARHAAALAAGERRTSGMRRLRALAHPALARPADPARDAGASCSARSRSSGSRRRARAGSRRADRPGRAAARTRTPPTKSPEPPRPGNPTKTFPDSPALRAEGFNLYQDGCSSCHGIALQGIPAWRRRCAASAPDRSTSTSRPAGCRSSTRARSRCAARRRLQPPADRRADRLRQLVRRARRADRRPGQPATSRSGFHEFTLNCAGCHQIVARGGITVDAQVARPAAGDARSRSPRRCGWART